MTTKRAKRPTVAKVKNLVRRSAVEFDSEHMKALHRESVLKKLGSWILDRKYRAVNVEAFEAMLAWSRVDMRAYRSEYRDCDNFAAMLHGQIPIRFGVNTCAHVLDLSGGHAYNAAVVYEGEKPEVGMPDLRIRAFDPRTDEWVEVGMEKHPYVGQRGVVLWS